MLRFNESWNRSVSQVWLSLSNYCQIFEGHSRKSQRLRFSVRPRRVRVELEEARQIRKDSERYLSTVASYRKGMTDAQKVWQTLDKVDQTGVHARAWRRILPTNDAAEMDMAIYPLKSRVGRSISKVTLLFRPTRLLSLPWRKVEIEVSPLAFPSPADKVAVELPRESPSSKRYL